MKMNKKGFTIVELVIVIAVIAILAGVMIPTFGGVIDNANLTTAKQEASNVYKQMCADADNIAMGEEFTEKEFAIVLTTTKNDVTTETYVCTVKNGVVSDAVKFADWEGDGYSEDTEKKYGTYSNAKIFTK